MRASSTTGAFSAGHRRRVTISVFVDALGWKLFERHGFLASELRIRRPLDTVLGYSSACDPTILTGAAPELHRHFSFFRYAPERSPFRGLGALDMLPRALTSRARVRRWISRIVGWHLGVTGYFQLYNVPFSLLPLFEYTERRDIYRPGGINGGLSTLFDVLRQHRIPFHVSDWRRPEADICRTAVETVREGRIQFAYILLGELDAVLHAHGTDAPQIVTTLRRYETFIHELLEHARSRYDEVSLFVFSDHGMTDVSQTVDLQGWLAERGLRFGRDYVGVFDSTMGRFWCPNDEARNRLRSVLNEQTAGCLLSEEELTAYGCAFPGHEYGELIFLVSPGVLICPSFMGERPVAGMHGYAPGHPDSVAAFGATHTPRLIPTGLTDLKATILADVQQGLEVAA